MRGLCRKGHDLQLKCPLDALSIGLGQSIFGAKYTVSPICGFLVRLNLFDFGCEFIA
jgi:hypothetical protein